MDTLQYLPVHPHSQAAGQYGVVVRNGVFLGRQGFARRQAQSGRKVGRLVSDGGWPRHFCSRRFALHHFQVFRRLFDLAKHAGQLIRFRRGRYRYRILIKTLKTFVSATFRSDNSSEPRLSRLSFSFGLVWYRV